MDGLHLITKQHLLDSIAPLLEELADHVWIVWSGYAAFLWAGDEDDAPGGFHEHVARLDPDVCAYALGTEALLEFGSLMTLDWVDVVALAPGTDAATWWGDSGAGRRNAYEIYHPAEAKVISDAHLYARRVDGAFWDVFCRDRRWLDILRCRWERAPLVTIPPG